MPRIVDSAQDFVIHWRKHPRDSRRAAEGDTRVDPGGWDGAVLFPGESGQQLSMPIPESYKKTQPYQQGHVKHYMIAVNKGLSEDPEEQAQGEAYVKYGVRRQENAGARFLDVNVDEVSYRLEVQIEAMECW